MDKNKKGFTLVELIVVIAIIGILAAVLFPTITGYMTNARISQHEQEAGSINTVLAVESIFNEVNYFQPQELETLLVGMDYELESSVKGYAFFYHVEKNRVEYLKISEAQNHDSKLVYQGVESLFDNGLAYIDQADNDIRETIDGVRNLVSDVRIDALKVSTNTSVTPKQEDDYTKVMNAMKSRFTTLKSNLKTISSSRLDLFDPNNGVLYFDHSGTYGTVTKVIQAVVFAPSVSTLKTAYADLKLHENLVIEFPSSVEIVEASLFSNVTVYKNETELSDKKVNFLVSSNVRFTGNLSNAINKVIKDTAINYTNLINGTDFELTYNVHQTLNSNESSQITNVITNFGDSNDLKTYDSYFSDSSMNSKTIVTASPKIKLLNDRTVKFADIVSFDVRSRLVGNLQLFSAVAIDKNFAGFKLQNVGSILDVNLTISNLHEKGVLTQGNINGKRIIISDPTQGYELINFNDLKIEVTVSQVNVSEPSIVTLSKVTNTSNHSNEIKLAFMGDYYFEKVGTNDAINFASDIVVKRITIKNGTQTIFVKAL